MNQEHENTISHEELCAYVLGEVEAAERARVESALEASAELRDQRDAISATIGLVQEAYGDEEGLAPEILGRLETAARPAPRPTPWYAAPPLQVAAGVAALAGGVLLGRALLRERVGVHDEAVARLEAPAEAPALESDRASGAGAVDRRAERRDGPDSSGMTQGVSDEPLAAIEEPAPQHEAGKEAYRSQLDSIGYVELEDLEESTGEEAPTLSVDELQALSSLGYGDGGEDSVIVGTVLVDSAPTTTGAAGTYRGPGDSTPPGAGGNSTGATGSDDFFLGYGGGAAAPGTERARKQVKNKIADLSGATRPGPSGPSSPGPLASPPSSAAPPPAREALGLSERGAMARVAPEEEYDADEEVIQADDALKGFYDDAGRGRSSDKDLRRDQDLTPAQVDELCKQRVERILHSCRRRPNERPRDMFFRYWGDNAFELTRLDAQSTFAVDVDTASYALARRYLIQGNLPEKAQVRTEEFVNYFEPDVPAPTEETFAVHTDLTASRFGADPSSPTERSMLRVVVRGREVARDEREPLALTFVVDTSGSMEEGGRLGLVKHALRLLVGQLDANDSIAIVAFSNEARVVLPMTSAATRGVIEAAIYGLNPDGGTNAEAGLRVGYEIAATALSNQVHNRVVLLSDGVANIGQTDQDRLNGDVKARRDQGIYLNTIGVGMNNHNDAFLEQLADKGDGLCNYIDSAVEARRALVENFTGAFEPIARDVKIQVEFDPAQVARYRLLGYENRAIADADFRNDAVDAGEVGAGHQVTALYELELTGAPSEAPLAEVRLRWKAPTGAGRDPREDSATERSFPVSIDSLTTWEAAGDGYKRSTLVAQFAEILRRSVHARNDSLDELISEAVALQPRLSDPDFDEFVALLQKSRELILKHLPRRDTLTLCIDSIRRNQILRAQYEELRQAENQEVLAELERENRELEARITELIRGELEAQVK